LKKKLYPGRFATNLSSIQKKKRVETEKEAWWFPDDEVKELVLLRKKVASLQYAVHALLNVIGDLTVRIQGLNITVTNPFKAETFAEPPACPQCGSHMVLRKGKYGSFWGCSRYPDCKAIKRVPKEQNQTMPLGDFLSSVAQTLKGNVELNNVDVTLPWEEDEKNEN
jgi:hypothetical protein